MGFLRRLFGGRDDAADGPGQPQWPAAGEGPFDVEQYGGEWQYSVNFDDVVAHEEEDRVAAFVDLLASQPGVKAAAHEDREVVLVKARGLSQVEMQAAAERAWAAAGQKVGSSRSGDDEDEDDDADDHD
jgi:hypothetical protein